MKLENRYIVIKRKHLDLLPDEARDMLEDVLTAISIAQQNDVDTGSEGNVGCLVIEKDWPIYEQSLSLLEKWVDEGACQ